MTIRIATRLLPLNMVFLETMPISLTYVNSLIRLR